MAPLCNPWNKTGLEILSGQAIPPLTLNFLIDKNLKPWYFISMNEKALELIRKVAAQKVSAEDENFNVMDYSGGNFEDAFNLGFEFGEISMARVLLDLIVNSQ